MLTVGDKFPMFKLKAVVSSDPKTAFQDLTDSTYEGKWLVCFFWPKDFTFVCPTEIKAFGDLAGEFADRDAQVLGFSTDSEFVHHAWRVHHDDLKALCTLAGGDIPTGIAQLRSWNVMIKGPEIPDDPMRDL